MSRNRLLAGVIVAVALIVPAPVLAQEGTDTKREDRLDRVTNLVESTVQKTEDSVDGVAKNTTELADQAERTQKDQVEARKAELHERLAQRSEDRKAKLEGRRLAQCQNRQAAINGLIDKSASIGQAKFDRIKSFEDAIKKFYTDQSLSSDSYEAAVAAVDTKRADATAALEVMAEQNYECGAVDATDPSATIKSVHESKRQALNDYRDSVQELLKTVRAAFAQKTEEE